jgi:hypothetical protein
MLQSRHLVLATAVVVLLAGGYVTADGNDVPFPATYRTWAHVKTVLIGPSSPAKTELGFHHIYANETALAGYRTGTFPDGSIIVYEVVTTTEQDGETREGSTRRLDVMVKDQTRFAKNAGWAFGRFTGGTSTGGALPAATQANCLACHGGRKDHDYVHSDWRR